MHKEQTYLTLSNHIKTWAKQLGFQQVGIALAETNDEKDRLNRWLEKNYHGSMSWMASNVDKRLDPSLLHPGTIRVISVRMNYLVPDTNQIQVLKSPEKAYVSRYALGRDYHKLIRKRLAKLSTYIEDYCNENAITINSEQIEGKKISQRPFVDSAPVLERPLAEKAGLGWIGKHTLVINEKEGSWFFLGEIYTNLPLPINQHIAENKCGECQACLKVCPTDAFPEPYVLDGRRCISYLTIEHDGIIPEEFREPMGNRVFGCDDCQAICPWNKYAQHTEEDDFTPRNQLDSEDLVTLFQWSEDEFLEKTAGSPIRRIGYENWLRNLSIGLGNAPAKPEILDALKHKETKNSAVLREHFDWAIKQQLTPGKRRKRKLRNPNQKL